MARKAATRKTDAGAVPVKTLDGKKVADAVLTWCATAEASPLLLAQVLHTDEQHGRIRTAHTKDRAEVRGGGRKPWRQKGTGRARHGSSRSPLWVGGGTTFGPRSRHEYLLRLPSKMRQLAWRAAWGEAVRAGNVGVVRFENELPNKTGAFVKLLPSEYRGLLIVAAPAHAALLRRVGKNVRGLTVVSAAQVGVRELVNARQVWIDEAALNLLQTRGGKAS